MITVENVTKSYGRTRVLDKISFKVKGGEFVTIVGPSGAGKTTLLHAMTGALPISDGFIQVDQYAVHKLSSHEIQEYRRRIGIIFQDYKLLPKKTVFENVAFALEVAGYDEKTIRQRTVAVLKLTGLENKRNNFPKQLSGGEKQRAAIARALVHNPELLLADEPTGNLDPENTLALAKLLKKINKSGTTIILSTHNKDVVKTIGGRIIKLDKGKLISDKKGVHTKIQG
ncbi:ATP-binding cassette domain-containing protein [Candidatus Gracilibacteria bacterium]|nr:ATP-binding cassette domain-containing protein [Candidatus Gracilibacteria bacterium]